MTQSKHRDALSIAGLLLFQLSLNLILVASANHQGVLTWEEAGPDFREVFLLPERVLYYPYAWAYLFFSIASKAFSPLPLFYARWVTAVWMSLLSPLVFILCRKLNVSRRSAVMAGVLTALFPGVFSFTWLGTAFGPETVFGAIAIALVSSTRWWIQCLGMIFLGMAVDFYGPGLAFLLPVFLIAVSTPCHSHEGSRRLQLGLVVTAGIAALILPLMLIHATTYHAFTGGGKLSSFGEIFKNTGVFVREFLYRTGSYYCFPHYAALSNPLIGVLVALGLTRVFQLQRQQWTWVILGLAGSVGIYVLSGSGTGIRRGIPILFFSALLLGAAFDFLGSTFSKGGAPVRILRTISLLFIFAYPAVQYFKTSARLRSGQIDLPSDFRFKVVPPLANMEKTMSWLLEHPQRALDPGYETSIVLPTLYLMSLSQPGGPIFKRAFVLEKLKKSIDLRFPE